MPKSDDSSKQTKSPSKQKDKAITKSKKSTPQKQPKTVLDKIVYAIRNDPARGPNGASRVSIQKYIKSEFDYDNKNALKLAFKKGVSNGVLIQTGQSFSVKGDPVVHVQEEEPLQMLDVLVGKGDEAQIGDTVTVKYAGTLDNGYLFDAANSFSFVLGAGDVIKGWDQGVKGMRVGGKRKLVVPSKLGYGKRGCSPDIPPNATLHFVIWLKKVSAQKDDL